MQGCDDNFHAGTGEQAVRHCIVSDLGMMTSDNIILTSNDCRNNYLVCSNEIEQARRHFG